MDTAEDIYVTLTGPSHFSADVVYVGQGRYLATYEPLDAGKYELRVEIFRRSLPKQLNYEYDYWQPLGASPYTILVHPVESSGGADTVPSKILVHPGECHDVDERIGRWVRCQDIGEPCIRSGWIWLPRDCHYRHFSREDLVQIPEPTWIVFVGTSVQRGTFLAGVDYILGERAANLSTSTMWKCWGYMEFRIGNLRLAYLDHRNQCMTFNSGSSPHESCQPDYHTNTERMFRKLANDPAFGTGSGPDVVVFEVVNNLESECMQCMCSSGSSRN